jgi:hypothetical protein
MITLTGCNKSYVRPQPPLIECDAAQVPEKERVTKTNAPELIVSLYGYIEGEHACLDAHRKAGDIR